jgi:hypothetical protein
MNMFDKIINMIVSFTDRLVINDMINRLESAKQQKKMIDFSKKEK